MPSTPGGVPYPSNTDLVKDGADAMHAIATAVDLRAMKEPRLAEQTITGGATPADANTLFVTGFYWLGGAGHGPTASEYHLLVIAGNSSYVVQIAFSAYSTAAYRRATGGGAAGWTAWVPMTAFAGDDPEPLPALDPIDPPA